MTTTITTTISTITTITSSTNMTFSILLIDYLYFYRYDYKCYEDYGY